MNRVSVAFICDENFAMPTCVAIDSMRKSKNADSHYVVYVVTTGLTEQTIAQFALLEQDDVEIHVLSAPIEKYKVFESTINNTMSNVSTAALLKFDLPNLIPDEDKLLYLDGDIIVRKDLTALFVTELGDHYLAAVMDSSSMYTERNLPVECTEYFNSGVMLLNLHQMREENVTDRLIQVKHDLADIRLMDQNVFNIVMVGRIVTVPIRYNFMYTNLKRAKMKYTFDQLNEMFGTAYETLDEILDDSVIVHFASKDKPWKFVDTPLQDEWFELFNHTSYRRMIGCGQEVEPLVSLIILASEDTAPDYLKQTLKSLALQPHDRTEVVIVSPNMNEDQITDLIGQNNIRSIHASGSQAAMLKKGIQSVRGQYISYIEAGNVYSIDACAAMEEFASAPADYDVVHYGIKAWSVQGLSDHCMTINEGMRIAPGSYTQEQYWEMVGKNSRFTPSLRSCLVRKKVYEQMIGMLPEALWNQECFQLIAVLALHCIAKGIHSSEAELISFCLNRVKYEHRYTNIEQFRQLLMAMDYEPVFVQNWSEEQCDALIYLMKRYIIREWLFHVKESLAPAAFDLLWSRMGNEVVRILSAEYCNDQRRVASRIQGSAMMERKKHHPIHTVGFYFHNIYNGGIQRVIALMARILSERDYRIVLFTDEEPVEGEYPLPEGVERCILPDGRIYRREQYGVRGDFLADALKKYEVDILLNNAWNSGTLLWDTIIAKSVNVPVVAHVHNIGALWFSENKQPMNRTEIYKLLDGAVVLSRVEEHFFSQFTNARYIPNPCSFGALENCTPSTLQDKTCLWLGRMDSRKNPEHALHAFAKVVRQIPDARLMMVGGGDEKVIARIEDLIDWYGLNQQVELHQFTPEVEPFYQRASLFLMTSYHEGYPMTLIESKAYGVPAIVYNMPYLEMLRENKGMTIIERGNIDALADAMIMMLSNPQKLIQQGIEARESVSALTDDVIFAMWKEVFHDVENGVGCRQDDTVRIMLENIMEYHELGVLKYVAQANDRSNKDRRNLQKQVKDLQAEKGKHWNEMQEMRRQNSERWHEMQDLRKQYSERWYEMQDLRRQYSERWFEMQELRKQNSERYQQMQELRRQNSERYRQIQELQKEKGERWQELQALRKQNKERYQQIQALQKEKDERVKEVQMLKKNGKSSTSKKVQVKRRIKKILRIK